MTQTDNASTIAHANHGNTGDKVTHRIREAATSAQDTLHGAADALRESASTAVEKGTDHAQAVQTEFDSAVRRNPTLAIAGAVGVGVLLGMALNRRA